jgi:hypothetical protein
LEECNIALALGASWLTKSVACSLKYCAEQFSSQHVF